MIGKASPKKAGIQNREGEIYFAEIEINNAIIVK